MNSINRNADPIVSLDTNTTGGAPSQRRMTRRLLALTALATVAGSGFAIASPSMANASATVSTPILLVHGFDGGGIFGSDVPLDSKVDCKNSIMTSWANGLRARGFTNVKTVGYYNGDINCDLNVPGRADNTINTSISQLGREFANLVSTTFTAHRITVAISAHSMGGLIVRRALDGVMNHHGSFPTTLSVSDVVTSGTPHAGSGILSICGVIPAGFGVPTQCTESAPGSAFLGALAPNPQVGTGTDWTLIGSDCDLIVTTNSALSMARGPITRPSVFVQRFVAPAFLNGGCLFGTLGFDHGELVTQPQPLDAISNGLLTVN